jgi:predicted DsbA family dithiol-disulfide isomerase
VSVEVRFITDPACSWSWSAEPAVRKLMVEFGETLRWTWVMGGLARDYGKGYADPEAGIVGNGSVYPALVGHWLDVADEGGMPIDPRLWTEGPIRSSYPACMAVKAAAEQSTAPEAQGGYAYLRALREGLLCFRRKLDTVEALVEEARRVRLDVQRFRRDLESHAIVEAFGRDLEEARRPPGQARGEDQVKPVGRGERVSFPSAIFIGGDGVRHGVFGHKPYEDYRSAALAAGARPADESPPGVAVALRRFGRMATREVEAVCDMREVEAAAELWRLASEWTARPVRVLTGHLWEPA